MTRRALAIDLGGTELRAAVVDEQGQILASAQTRTDTTGGPMALIGRMVTLLDEVRAAAPGEVLGLGLGAPGPLDSIGGIALAPPTLPGWRDVPLRDELAQRLHMPDMIENDANVAALGEWRYGVGRGAHSMVYVTVSTGIGGGVIVDGHLLRGRRGLASHVGHMRIAETSPEPCSCGASGCWEAFAAATALGRRAARMVEQGRAPAIGALAGSDAVTSRHVVEAARGRDPIALGLLADEAAYLGAGFANLLHLYSPERLVVGGGLGVHLDLMREGIVAAIERHAMPDYREVPIFVAALGGKAGLVGAGSLIFGALPAQGEQTST